MNLIQPTGFETLYEDGPVLIVNKPGGVLTQAPPNIDSLELRVRDFLRQRDRKEGNFYLAILHRIDRPASGALVTARHVRAARRIAKQFEGRMVQKIYWAVVEGAVEPDEGTWTDYIRKIPNEPRAEIVDRRHPEGRIAVLNYRRRAMLADRSWLEIELVTGRTHQIRVQAAARGFPVCGDLQYGSRLQFGPQTEDPRDRLIALHARSIELQHPMTREMIAVTAPLGAAWAEFNLPPAK